MSRIPSRTLVRTITVDAVGFFPIPCNYENGAFTESTTETTQWEVTVSGEGTLSAKLALGGFILRMLGAPAISVSVNVGGSLTYSRTISRTLELFIPRNDCHKETWKLYEDSVAVNTIIRDVEIYTWGLADEWVCGGTLSDPVWCPCPDGPVTTMCYGPASSGSGTWADGYDVETEVTPSCEPLNPIDPSVDPCCGRIC